MPRGPSRSRRPAEGWPASDTTAAAAPAAASGPDDEQPARLDALVGRGMREGQKVLAAAAGGPAADPAAVDAAAVSESVPSGPEGFEFSRKQCLKVFLYAPNLVGLARIAFAVAAFAMMDSRPLLAAWLYWASFALDFIDGTLARAFDQASRFGALLDMTTDRVATALLCVRLSHLYPRFVRGFQLLIALDIFSHFYQMMRQQMDGRKSHKEIHDNQSRLLRLYYSTRPLMGLLCTLNELFYCALYVTKFCHHWFYRLALVVSTPGWVVKQAVNVVQLCSACVGVVEYDLRARVKAGKKI